ncbi:MAG: hypothetical protein AMXMBFR6_22160 [Betaproteobacteria bacterium]
MFRFHDQQAPCAAGGIVGAPAGADGIRVRTILITAPQQVQTMGARSLTQAEA